MCVNSKLISSSDSVIPLLLWVNILGLLVAEMEKKNKAASRDKPVYFLYQYNQDIIRESHVI